MNEQCNPLPPGTIAPEFALPQSVRKSVSLNGLRGQPVILVFYPLDWESVSLQQLALCQDYLVEFERLGAHLIGISADHVFSHAALARHLRLGFPLLSDSHPAGAVARAYGVYRESQELGARALFVVDSSGIIRFGQTYPDLFNPGVNDILTILETLAAEEKVLQERAYDSNGLEPSRGQEAWAFRRYSARSLGDSEARASIHDLKQEIMVARGYAQLLATHTQRQGEMDDERIRKALERIDASATRMAALLDQTLTAADPNRM